MIYELSSQTHCHPFITRERRCYCELLQCDTATVSVRHNLTPSVSVLHLLTYICQFHTTYPSVPGLSNLLVWRATRAIFKAVTGRIIKINKTQITTCYSYGTINSCIDCKKLLSFWMSMSSIWYLTAVSVGAPWNRSLSSFMMSVCFLKSSNLCWKSSSISLTTNSENISYCTVSLGLVGFTGLMKTPGGLLACRPCVGQPWSIDSRLCCEQC